MTEQARIFLAQLVAHGITEVLAYPPEGAEGITAKIHEDGTLTMMDTSDGEEKPIGFGPMVDFDKKTDHETN